MTRSCTPAGGWGGAGDGCIAAQSALAATQALTDGLRAAFPEGWQSTAADEYVHRLGGLLLHCGRLAEITESAQHQLAELAQLVHTARSQS